MDLATLKDKLIAEEETLAKLQEEACNVENMTRSQKWDFLLPSIQLCIEQALQSGSTQEESSCTNDQKNMDEIEMLATLEQIRTCIDKKEFLDAFKLVRMTETMFPGASELR